MNLQLTTESKRVLLRALAQAQDGRVFTVTFTKKDGTLRTLNGRLGVTKHLKGGENTVQHLPQYLTVYDMQKQDYRNVNLDTVLSLKCAGVEYIERSA